MTVLEKSNFSFTFTITCGKNVYFKGGMRQFDKLSFDEQYEFLEKQMIRSYSKYLNSDQILWVYEIHKDKPRLHIHGFILDAYEAQVEEFRGEFYRHPIRYSYSTYKNISNIQKTYHSIQYFIDYMNKEQSDIKYHMSYIVDKKTHASLDGHNYVHSIEQNSNISNKYIHSLDEHLNGQYVSEDYLFGKKNKFILDF